MKQKQTMVRAKDLRLDLSGREIFNITDLTLSKGEVLALVGPNGAGKSSLLLTLALLQSPTGGTIRIDGQVATNGNSLLLRRRMAIVFQEALLLDLTVQQNVMTALRIRGVSKRDAAARTARWLDQFRVAHLARQSSRCLSGGEAQRASLARAFALEPEILFLDEPFAALDYPTRKLLLNELGQLLKDMNMTTLFVTHDYSEIPYIANRVAVLYEGKILKEGAIEDIFGEEISKRIMWVPWDI